MGVSGAGKTTIGKRLARALGWRFIDGDELHPAANIAKMRRGIPLDDDDRGPWLDSVRKLIAEASAARRNEVIACSALKRAYRARLMIDSASVRLVYLKGRRELIERRLAGRRHHFMDPGLLASQFEALEEPGDDALAIDVEQSPAAIVEAIRQKLDLKRY